VNLLVSLNRSGFRILEVPTEWTDKVGSKVTASLFRSSLVMFLSVFRLWLIYSGIAKHLQPLSPLSAWAYRKLRAPHRPGPTAPSDSTDSKTDKKEQKGDDKGTKPKE